MRDPARIERMLDKLFELWSAVPDQRLGQVLINYLLPPIIGDAAIFYAEDDIWEKILDKGLEEMHKAEMQRLKEYAERVKKAAAPATILSKRKKEYAEMVTVFANEVKKNAKQKRKTPKTRKRTH